MPIVRTSFNFLAHLLDRGQVYCASCDAFRSSHHNYATSNKFLKNIALLIRTTTGLSGVFLLSLITPLPASVGITTTFSTMIISGSIGLIFGVLPAKRASKLDPIVALRSL